METTGEGRLRSERDAALRERIEAALVENTGVDPSGIVVEVIGGGVTLGGVVRSAEERDDAEWAAWSVPGVAALDNRLVTEEEETGES